MNETKPSWWLNIEPRDQPDYPWLTAIIASLIKDHKEHQFAIQEHNKNKQIQSDRINQWNQWNRWKALKVTLKIIKNKWMNLAVVKGEIYPQWCWLIQIIRFSTWLTLLSL